MTTFIVIAAAAYILAGEEIIAVVSRWMRNYFG